MADQFSGKQRIGFIQQSKASNHWSAAASESANYKLVNYDKAVTISDPDIQIDQQNFINQRGLISEYERIYVDDQSGMPSLNFSGVATLSLLAPHLVAACQSVTEGATTPFTKTITSGFKAGALSWASNEGYLWTLVDERYDESGGDDLDLTLIDNALLDTFEFIIEPNNRGITRLARISGTWKGKSARISDGDGAVTALSGTLVDMPTTGFLNDGAKFTLNITGYGTLSDICFKRFAFRVENNLTSDCRGAGGTANNYKASPKYYVDIDLPYLPTYHDFGDLFKSGTEIAFDLETGSAGNSGHLKFDCDSAIVLENPFGFDGEYMSRPLRLELLSKSGDDQTPFEITLSDAVDWGF